MKKRHKIIGFAIMFSVICSVCFMYTEKAEAKSSLSSGNYYFNNSDTGNFLGRTSAAGSAAVTSMNGILSSIGSRIAWTVTMKDDTYCTMSGSGDSGFYLCCSSSGNISYTKKSAPDDSCLMSL